MKFLQSILISTFAVILLFNCLRLPTQAKTEDIGASLEVSATIGNPISLYGYTAPFSLVTVSGISLREEVKADQTGYFTFSNLYLLPQTREFCLTSIDKKIRTTNPVCLPAPTSSFTASGEKPKLGPVILPPTLSLAKGNFLVFETVAASGETLPNAEINISLFKDISQKDTLSFRLIPKVEAISLPFYTIKTDQNGSFSFNLPSGSNNIFRIFTQVFYNGSPSPKSNTLQFEVISRLAYLLKNFWFLFVLILIMTAGILIYVNLRKGKNVAGKQFATSGKQPAPFGVNY